MMTMWLECDPTMDANPMTMTILAATVAVDMVANPER